ncbi:MAG TPA: AAA family ATPase, partial [Planctomycetaceae bacterium]|nr:AAA family ATPase [Planctomycetaceae bacterium]
MKFPSDPHLIRPFDMLNTEALDDLRTRLLGGETLLFLQTHEEFRWERRLGELAIELERPLVKWSSAADHSDHPGDPIAFLKSTESFSEKTIFLIKDPHPFYSSPAWIRRVRELAESMKHKRQTMLMIGPDGTIPFDLEKQAHAIRLPLPGLEELLQELNLVLNELREQGLTLDPPPDEQERLAKTVLGLTADEARRAFRYSLMTQKEINDGLYALLISEKRQMVQGSDLLEFYDLEDGKSAIGGLEALKEWIDQRADAFSTAAQEQGIPTPKGVFLLGVQGCGKSLTARVAATMLRFPLIRLDTAALLASERGASEKNLREVLKLVETIAPAVLWIDEIEKGFGGFDTESDDATMSRIVGAFLTWMEEHKPPVFVVATANSIDRLPPEMLRRGRFDVLFFVDLPNFEERKSILRVHL